jgi:hypothetical protein
MRFCISPEYKDHWDLEVRTSKTLEKSASVWTELCRRPANTSRGGTLPSSVMSLGRSHCVLHSQLPFARARQPFEPDRPGRLMPLAASSLASAHLSPANLYPLLAHPGNATIGAADSTGSDYLSVLQSTEDFIRRARSSTYWLRRRARPITVGAGPTFCYRVRSHRQAPTSCSGSGMCSPHMWTVGSVEQGP